MRCCMAISLASLLSALNNKAPMVSRGGFGVLLVAGTGFEPVTFRL
jgi:hypothetical protein